ncbi:MAG: hypothetical protein COV59_02010 [Candidatus Magasanikbacteria bacterium CG11_big_fil_rev_8_21_14_0_20_39_34]|uniref:L,D-TPase catalytic domain-containing protein n=1 Tax=Candidatus Magasanikbacteria bacterium CG11_big_fil_rev_8_21_14_0_20_39_34 TaxID=1974653 RepID=A0A2H0N4W7_9BACT|nr:MAG: hypothetical protein COV59_02010 [Candidatus Magasanikbacteria bacterium CG11_big_fil_rev_8_21_14_0_20_39_34]
MKKIFPFSYSVTFLFFVLLVPGIVRAQEEDLDNDGLSDAQEVYYFTDSHNPDTDGDGYLDGVEVANNYSPHAGNGKMIYENDYDQDGLSDWHEMWFGSSIGNKDTDQDGVGDYQEALQGLDPTSKDSQKRYDTHIVVDRTKQRLYYYVSKLKMFNFPVSTGNPETETPAGEFQVERKLEVKRYLGPDYDLPNVKWNMEFKPGYYIHSAYWHNDFGKKTHSHGCVNLREADAKELYQYATLGTHIEVIGETPKHYSVEI